MLSWGSLRISFNELLEVLMGDTKQVSHQLIVWEYRFPKAIAAFLIGGLLALSGLLLQNTFNNLLAGPSVLGITSGASLGAALFYLTGGAAYIGAVTGLGALTSGGVLLGSMAGAGLVLVLIMVINYRVRSNATLLIMGMMLAALVGAIVTVLQYFANPDEVKAFVMWSFGSLGGVGWGQIGWVLGVYLIVAAGSWFLSGQLNVMTLGDQNAKSLGVNYPRLRNWILLLTGLACGAATGFCGPIAFVGIIVPHLVRGWVKSSNHFHTIPVTLLMGGWMLMVCDWVAQLPGIQQALPLNAVTAAIGGPVILWILFKGKWSKGLG